MLIKQNTFQHKEGMVPNMPREAKIQSNTSETLDPNMANAMKNAIKFKQNTTHQLSCDKAHMVVGTFFAAVSVFGSKSGSSFDTAFQ